MTTWIETHGIETLIIYYVVSSLISTMPPVADNSSYWIRWFYGFMHALAADWKQVAASLNLKVPVDPDTTTTTTEIKQKIVENKTDPK
ncbi:MAG: hypothetical protein ACREJN_21410 [Nitrospiraceae bacterium]